MNNKGTILVVDDDLDILYFLSVLLQKHGYEIRTAESAIHALEMIAEVVPDLILSDIRMPEMNGFEFCRKLKNETAFADIPLIFLTADNSRKDVLEGLSLGAVDYITKPFHKEELIARVKTHLNLFQLNKKLFAQTVELTSINTQLKRTIIERDIAEKDKLLFANAVDSSLNEIYIFSIETLKFRYINHGALKNLDYNYDTINQLNINDIESEFEKTDFELLSNTDSYGKESKIIYETEHRRSDGSTYPVEAHLQYYTTDSEKYFLLIAIDITQRKNVEIRLNNEKLLNIQNTDLKFLNEEYKTLNKIFLDQNQHVRKLNDQLHIAKDEAERNEQKYRSLFENMVNGFVLCQVAASENNIPTDFRILEVNKYFNDFLELDITEIKGKKISEIFPTIKHDLIKQLATVVLTGEHTNNEHYSKHYSKHFYVHAYISQEGMVAAIFEDITNRKLAEQTLQEREKQLSALNETKDKLFSIIAHDLKSPFTSILGFSQLLIENIRKYDITKTELFLGYINSHSKSTFTLLENLLSWAKSQTGKISYQPEKLNFNEIVKQVIDLSSLVAKVKKISLNYFLSENVTVFADKNMLDSILRNLISNAIKFTNEGGTIDIYAISENDAVEITVSDNGVGMTEEVMKKLFSIDKNHTSIGTNNEKGTGLGLIICKEFVEKHGGKISVESLVGEGTSFKFTLPNNEQLIS